MLKPALLRPGIVPLAFAAAVGAALVAGQGGPLQYAYPVAALVTAVVIERRSLSGYLSFVIWIWLLTPFVRRVADFQSGWHDPSLIMLAPYGVSGWPAVRDLLKAAVRWIRVAPAFDGLGVFVVAGAGAAIGVPMGLLTAPVSAFSEALNWLVPVAFGAYVAVRAVDVDELERTVALTLLQAAIVLGAYAFYQFMLAPPWDTEWMRNTEAETFGRAREYEVRVFSTSHSPGVLATLIFAPIVLWMARPRPWSVLSFIGASLALALSQVRAAWLALAVATVLVQIRVTARERLALGALALVAFLAAAPWLLPFEISDTTSQRFLTLMSLNNDESALSRYQGHEEAFDIVRAHPFGLGIGIEDPGLVQVIGMRDSILVTALVEFGLIGAAVYFLAVALLIVRLLLYYLRAPTNEGLALSAIGLGLIAIGMFGTVTAGPPGILTWLTVGLASVRVRQQRLAARASRIGRRAATAGGAPVFAPAPLLPARTWRTS